MRSSEEFSEVSKRGVADHLLEAAVAALLDRSDALSAIVLGGSAEDVYQGLLKLQDDKGPSAREELAKDVIAIAGALYPDEPAMTDRRAFDAIRGTFNWLRHNDRAEDQQTRVINATLEAAAIVERAMFNQHLLSGREHPRMQELLRLMRC